MRNTLLRCGYSACLVETQFRRAISKDRDELLTSHRNDNGSDRVPLTVTYCPHTQKLRRILADLQHLFHEDEYLSKIFSIAFRHPPNLRSLLVHSRLVRLSNDDNERRVSVSACRKPPLTCNLLSPDTAFERNGARHVIRDHFNCPSSIVIYLIRAALLTTWPCTGKRRRNTTTHYATSCR